MVIVDPPSVAALGDSGGSKDKLAELKGSGDKSQLLMFLQAQAQMLSAPSSSGGSGSGAGGSGSDSGSIDAIQSAGNTGSFGGPGNVGIGTGDGGSSNKGSPAKPGETKKEPTEKEKEAAAKEAAKAKEAAADAAAAAQGDMKVDQITAVLETGGGKVTDLASAEIMSTTIESIIGKPAQEGEKSSLGQEILKKTTSVLGELVDSMTGLTDAVDPEKVKPSITSVTNTIGTLFDALYGMSSPVDLDLDDVAEGTAISADKDVNDEIR